MKKIIFSVLVIALTASSSAYATRPNCDLDWVGGGAGEVRVGGVVQVPIQYDLVSFGIGGCGFSVSHAYTYTKDTTTWAFVTVSDRTDHFAEGENKQTHEFLNLDEVAVGRQYRTYYRATSSTGVTSRATSKTYTLGF